MIQQTDNRASNPEPTATVAFSNTDSLSVAMVDSSQQAVVDTAMYQLLRKSYIDDYNYASTQIRLNADADSITVSTAADSLTLALKNSIRPIFHTAKAHVEKETKLRHDSQILQQKDWILPIVLLAIIIFGWIRQTTPKYLGELSMSLLSDLHWSKIIQEVRLQYKRPSLLLFAVYHLIIPLIIYEFFAISGMSVAGHQGIVLYLIIMLAVTLLLVLRYSVYRLLGYIFDTGDQTGLFMQTSMLFTNIVGACLIPLALAIPFVNSEWQFILLKLGASLFVVLYVWMLFRGFKIILDGLLSIFYMILYLCALEIVPVLWLFKLLAG